ncbi:MAG: LuxR C-terminal-related transcriptional regulator [Limnobacter sp.]|nr:LuxR C-terminal-related transcriptional regulator [Limnobacter sp.]
MSPKNVVVIEGQTLTGMALKELVLSITPNAQVKCFSALPQDLPPNNHLLIVGLPSEAADLPHQMMDIQSLHAADKIVFLVDQVSAACSATALKMNSQVISRSASSMEIIDCLQISLGMKSMLVDVLGAGRNSFQSPIQMPNASKPLTVKQVQVMELMLQGNTIRQIAEGLGLSVDTVKSHIKDAFHRLNASSRSGALSNYIQAKKLATQIQPEVMEHFMGSLLAFENED